MKRYLEYKDSGVDWIGEIPAHWKVRRNKRIFNERDDRSATGKEELLTVSHITGVSPRAEKNVGMFLAETLEGYKHCSAGNLVINTMWAWMGALGISTFDGIVSPSYNVYQLKSSEYLPRYYDYLYRIPNHVGEIIRWSKGVWHSRLRLYPDAFFGMSAITPPFREQTQIANFLDRKTGQIDELIRIKERRIELLQEQRTALINQAVTKGLDLNVEMKSSGVEWIGEIPSHWEVLKVKHVGSSNPSKNNPKTDRLKDKLVVFLPMERVHTDGTIDQELRHPYSQLKNGYTYFEENDILIAKVTPCFENGKIVLVKNLATPVGFGSTEFIVIRPNPQKVFTPFLYYILYNAPLRRIGKHFMTSAVGLKRVPTEFIENFQIPIPTYQEQTQIANFLDRKTGQIDELIAAEQRKVELLKEYRQSLISEAVTGKIDIRSEV